MSDEKFVELAGDDRITEPYSETEEVEEERTEQLTEPAEDDWWLYECSITAD